MVIIEGLSSSNGGSHNPVLFIVVAVFVLAILVAVILKRFYK